MLNIGYEILLNNENRPIVKFSDTHEGNSEDKFLAFEMTRYYLTSIMNKNSHNYDENTVNMMDISIRLLGQISDEIAKMIWNEMVGLGDADVIFNRNYHFSVEKKADLENINEHTSNSDKIYTIQDGLRVLVNETQNIFEYNEKRWEEVK